MNTIETMEPNWTSAVDFNFPYTAPSNGFAWTLSTSWPSDGVFRYTVNGKSVGCVYTPNRSNVQIRTNFPNKKVAFGLIGNGTVTIKTKPDENSTMRLKVRRRTKIKVRRA